MDFCGIRSGTHSDTEVSLEGRFTPSPAPGQRKLSPKDVGNFLPWGKTGSNKTSEKSVFYLIFSGKSSTLKINHFPGSRNLIGFNHLAGKRWNRQCDDAKCVIAELCFHWYRDVPAGHCLCPCAASAGSPWGSSSPLVLLQGSKWAVGTKDKHFKAALRWWWVSPVLLLAVLWEGFAATAINWSRLLF